jgi:hypothetical protein
MRHPWGRWTLVVVAIAAAAGAAGWAVTLEEQVLAARTTAAQAAIHARTVRGALGDVRRALAAMASPGQAAAGWSRQAGAAITQARHGTAALLDLVPAATPPRSPLDVLDRLGEAERRIREHAVGGKPLFAADVAFGEALPHLDELERQIAGLHETADETAARQVASVRDRQLLALAGALLGLALTTLLLAPIPRSQAAPVVAAAAPTPDVVPLVQDVPPPSLPLPGPTAPADVPPVRPAGVRLPDLAAACRALAAASAAADLPAALDQARIAVSASGLMLWVADSDRRRLHAAAQAGYDPRLVERLGAVELADDNPTARAFATGEVVTTDARPGRPAAAALPVTGPAGVAGVLTVELDAAALESPADVAAALQIVAAQLATLVAAETPTPTDASAPELHAQG